MESSTLETIALNQEFNRLASAAQVVKTARALEANGIHTVVFETGEEARAYALSLLPAGAVVYNPPSRTLEQIGLAADIESAALFQPLRARLRSLDRIKDQSEIRKLVAGPDVVVGSVHAITENVSEGRRASLSAQRIRSVRVFASTSPRTTSGSLDAPPA